MLLWSFVLLLITTVLGTALAGLHLRGGNTKPPRWPFGALHGLLGIVGLGALLIALRGLLAARLLGVGGFGSIAAVLLAAALLAGLAVLIVRWRYRRVPGLVIGIHATIAVSGVDILSASSILFVEPRRRSPRPHKRADGHRLFTRGRENHPAS